MSINVNVSGNPVLIRNGKMVNSYNKDEFDRRRLMRLQQVRQQSKIFADKVRKKVNQNKPLQPTTTTTPITTGKQSDFEQKSEEQLQNWQAKKLLELQNQYQDALSEIGLGQRQIDNVSNEDDVYKQQQVEKNEHNIKQAIPIQRKKIVRDIENERAANLQKVQQNKVVKTTKKKKTNSIVEQEKENQQIEQLDLKQSKADTTTNFKEHSSKEQQTTPSLHEETRIKDKFVQTIESDLLQPQQFPRDTRISERIKWRDLPDPLKDDSITISDDITTLKTEKLPIITCCHHCQCGDKESNHQQTTVKTIDEIPKRTKIKLKQTSDNLPTTTGLLNNQPSSSSSSIRVDRICNDDFLTSPILSDCELDEKLKQREKEAKLRGKKALERERINRDYRELLRNLPTLQKQEQLYDIGRNRDNTKFHMTNERLIDIERKKQNQLDNIYEKLFVNEPKLTTITLPKQQQDRINWDTESNLWKSDRDLHDELKELLQQLQQRKDQLLRENNKDDKKRKRNVISPNSSDNDVCIESVDSKTTQTQLGRKKQKIRTKRILILQNISTQTSPRIQTDDVATSPIISNIPVEQQQSNTICTCDKNKQDPYEIIIKFQQDNQPEVVVPSATKIEIKPPTPPQKPRLLWREILKDSGTSTSYYSPVDFSKSSSLKSSDNDDRKLPQFKRSIKFSKTHKNSNIDPRLLKYIEKLLESSRQYINELSTSSPSDVSTPSQTTIDIQSNQAMKKLKNVMKYFNLTSDDVKNALKSTNIDKIKQESTNEQNEFKTPINQTIRKTPIDQYSEIVDACSEKISNLSNMIDKVRAEKDKILNETTTKSKELSNESPTAAIKKLFVVDENYATQLKTLTQEDIKQHNDDDDDDEDVVEGQEAETVEVSDGELFARYKRLKEASLNLGKTKDDSSTRKIPQTTPPIGEILRKSPKVQMSTPNTTTTPPSTALMTTGLVENKTKPPPSKGLTTPQQLLGIPHELSTILEIENFPFDEYGNRRTLQLNDDSEKSQSDHNMEHMLNSIGMAWAIPTIRKTRQTLEMASTSTSSTDDLKNVQYEADGSGHGGGGSSGGGSNKESLKSFLSRHLNIPDDVLDDVGRLTSTPVFDVDPNVGGLFDTELSSVQEQNVQRSHDSDTSPNNNQGGA